MSNPNAWGLSRTGSFHAIRIPTMLGQGAPVGHIYAVKKSAALIAARVKVPQR